MKYVKAQAKKYVQLCTSVLACTLFFSAATPCLAFADESAGIGAILPDMTEFIPMLIAFLILLFVLSKFGWPLFDKVLADRESSIRESLEKAESARIESERTLAEYKEQLLAARQEAQTIVTEAKQTGDKIIADLTAQAHSEAENMIAKAREAIETEKHAALADLQNSVADLTVAVATRVISEDFSDAEHRKLIERSLEKVGSLNG